MKFYDRESEINILLESLVFQSWSERYQTCRPRILAVII